MKARFIGDPNDDFSGPATLKHSGHQFPKRGTVEEGKSWVEVPDSVGERLKGNNHFQIEGEAAPEPGDAADTRSDEQKRLDLLDLMRDYLDQKGIKYKKNISDSDLESLYAETKAANVEQDAKDEQARQDQAKLTGGGGQTTVQTGKADGSTTTA